MNITRNAWIFVGIFLWGIPIGILFSIITACLKPHTLNQIQSFQLDIFSRNLGIWIPIFVVHGIIFGLVMDYFSRRYKP